MIPGEVIVKNEFIEINKGSSSKQITVKNEGDRPVQVGSHFHFFEVNSCLKFDRAEAYGYRLNIASGSAIRLEAGEIKDVELIPFTGKRIIKGLNNLVDAQLNDTNLEESLQKAKSKGFE